MKNIKYIILLLTVGILVSCEDSDQYTLESLENGGFITFMEAPEFRIGEDPTIAIFDGNVEDPNGNVAKYDLYVMAEYNGAPEDPILFKSTTEFPLNVGFNIADLAALYNVDPSVFEMNDDIFFTAIATTNDGQTFNGEIADFDDGEYNGGQNDNTLATTASLLSAMAYRVRLREPQ